MKSEYKACLRQLDGENKKLLRKIKLYVDSRHLNRVARRDLLGDIAGMALEAQKRGENFSDTIGTDYEVFCKELVKNSPRNTVREDVFSVLTFVFFFTGLIVPLIYAFSLLSGSASVSTNGAELTLPDAMLFKYVALTAGGVLGWFLAYSQMYRSSVGVAVIYVATLVFCIAVFDVFTGMIPNAPKWTVNVIWWALSFGALCLLCLTVNRLISITIAYRQQKKSQK